MGFVTNIRPPHPRQMGKRPARKSSRDLLLGDFLGKRRALPLSPKVFDKLMADLARITGEQNTTFKTKSFARHMWEKVTGFLTGLFILLFVLALMGCNSHDPFARRTVALQKQTARTQPMPEGKFARYWHLRQMQGSTLKIWQYLIPRYGFWGGPGWSGNQWSNDPSETDWAYTVLDNQDECYKRHDWKYQHSEWTRGAADRILWCELHVTHAPRVGPKVYKFLAQTVFAVRATFKRGGFLRRDRSIPDPVVPADYQIPTEEKEEE